MSKFQLSGTLIGHEQDVRDVVSPFDGTIISCLRDGTVRMWSIPDSDGGWGHGSHLEGSIIFNSPSGSFMNCVAFVDNESDPSVASAGKDCIIYLSDPYPSERTAGDEDLGKYQLIGHASNVCSLFYSHGALISGSWDTTAKVWDLSTCSVKYDLKGHQASVWDAKIIGESSFLTCSADRTIKKWVGNKEVASFTGHSDVVRKLLILPGNKQFASCSNDCTIKIWDLETGAVLKTLEGHESFVYDLKVLPNGDLVSSGEDRTVRVWRDGVAIQVIRLPCISLWCLSVCPNGDFVVGGSDNYLRVFTRSPTRVASNEEVAQLKKDVEQSSIAEQSVDNLKKTDIPGYEALENPGKQEGSTLMVKNASGTIEAHQWSGGEWIKIGDVVGSSTDTGSKKHFNGKEWDYLFDVDIEDGAPPLKLPYNANENAYTAAQRFLADNELPESYNDEVVRFIMQNTSGFLLGEGPIDNPYADSTTSKKTATSSTSLKVLPIKQYINFKDYKVEQLVKGLNKLNGEQTETARFNDSELSSIASELTTLTSKQSLRIITQTCVKILEEWSESSHLLAYDLLRVSVPRVTAVDLLSSTEVAEVILKSIQSGLKIVNPSTIPIFMMLLKMLNNLVGNTLFIQLFIDPTDEGKYQFNSIFQDLLLQIEKILNSLSSEKTNKHYSTMTTTLSTFIYNLSVYYLQTSLLNSSNNSVIPITQFASDIGDVLIKSCPEAAYRLLIAFGNFKYSKVPETKPAWISTAKSLYNEKRFTDLFSDIDHL
ncbi:uncharacterized protein PRCAT00005293001 [Priceomyces carsonii]|uniref:uncharacterized protein n=1 Tax=Priceomyces carsonii TaxID=28549 RepID=UPI002ED8B32E|nr:unnamed protein product [Priceomyces carsonii]